MTHLNCLEYVPACLPSLRALWYYADQIRGYNLRFRTFLVLATFCAIQIFSGSIFFSSQFLFSPIFFFVANFFGPNFFFYVPIFFILIFFGHIFFTLNFFLLQISFNTKVIDHMLSTAHVVSWQNRLLPIPSNRACYVALRLLVCPLVLYRPDIKSDFLTILQQVIKILFEFKSRYYFPGGLRKTRIPEHLRSYNHAQK